MKKLAAWSWWLDGCIWGLVLALGTAQAAPPPDVVIASADEALAFSDPEPFVFSGQTLSVQKSFSTDRDVRLDRFAPVIVGPGIRFELQGKVSSTGLPLGTPLEKRGSGTLVLAGENRYRSNTVLREGVLHLKGESALGDSLYSLEQHGGTVLQLEPGARLGNFIQLVDTRPGDTPLPGLEGTAHWRVDTGSATLSNNINALLPVRKTGAGTLRLGGIVQGHSNLFVEAGGLAVDSVAAARVSIGDGARLEGQGELAHLRVHAGGMVAPGGRDLPGALSVWGNAVFEADSLYHVNAYPDGGADMLRVGGQAFLDGRVQAQAGDGEWASEHRYLILSADAGLDGTVFAGVDTDLAFLDPSLDYDDQHVYLMLQRNDLEPGDIAETPDEEEVGDAISPPDRPRRPRPPRPTRPPRETKPVVVPPEPTPETKTPSAPEPETPEPKTPEPKIPEPKIPEPKIPEPKIPEPKIPEPKIPEPEVPEPEVPEQKAPEPDIAAPEISEPNLADIESVQPEVVHEETPSPLPEHEVVHAQPLTPLEDAMLGMSVEQVRSLLRQSSGRWHASVRSFLLEDSRHVRQALLASGRDAWGLGQSFVGGSAQGAAGPHGRASQSPFAAGWRSWAQVYSARGQRQAVATAAGDRHHSHGIVLGLDAPVARHWRVGMAMAFQQAELKQGGRQALAKADSLHAGVSAHADWNGMRLTTALLRTWHRIDSRRRVSAGPLQELQRSSYAGHSWQAVMELAPHLRSLREWGEWLRSGLKHAAEPGNDRAGPPQGESKYWRMGPYLRHEWQRLSLPGHQETGGLTAHDVAASTTAMHATTLGWRLRHDWQREGRPSWLEADLGWRRVWGNAGVSSSQRFLVGEAPGQPSPSFSSRGQPLARSALALTLEAGLAPGRNARVALRYSGLMGSTYHDHAAWADLRWVF